MRRYGARLDGFRDPELQMTQTNEWRPVSDGLREKHRRCSRGHSYLFFRHYLSTLAKMVEAHQVEPAKVAEGCLESLLPKCRW